jgi:hypothetical protein
MIQHNGFLLVEVPEGAKDFSLIGVLHKASNWMLWFNDSFGHDGTCEILLPTGNYQIIGMGKDLSSDQKARIAEDKNGYFPDYEHRPSFHTMPEQSFLSLIKSHGLKPENCLILKSVV